MDAAVGDMVSVVTGKGVILNVYCSGTVDEGKLLEVVAAGVLVTGTDATLALSGTTVGVAMTGATVTANTYAMHPVLMRN
jgi:hypothetical protein